MKVEAARELALCLPYVPPHRTASRRPRGQDAPLDAPRAPAHAGLTLHIPDGQSLAVQSGVLGGNTATIGDSLHPERQGRAGPR